MAGLFTDVRPSQSVKSDGRDLTLQLNLKENLRLQEYAMEVTCQRRLCTSDPRIGWMWQRGINRINNRSAFSRATRQGRADSCSFWR